MLIFVLRLCFILFCLLYGARGGIIEHPFIIIDISCCFVFVVCIYGVCFCCCCLFTIYGTRGFI